ncbi:AAA family ATPase [Endozoicomonas sp. ALB032]|uniref:AAA family ATPase n=1 Tax=Endozoicomonas sp. ALB032 TaxID=3403082 RepID=UPI003BB66620
MDGQMVGEINKPVPAGSMPDRGARDSNPSYTGMPAKRPRLDLDLPPKVEAVCSGFAYQLNLSSSQIMTPDRARAVSLTDSPLQNNPHAFDFRFVASDDEVRQLLADQTRDKNRDVTLISQPDDLAQANLVSRLTIADNGRHALRPGKLFEGSLPLTLVIDIRKLTSEDLPKFNDLLDPDNPCLYDKVSQKKRPLGEHVSLLVLAAPAQLAAVGQCDDAPAADAPGADFWRRINRPGNSWQFQAETGNDPSMDIDGAPPLLPEFPSAENAMDDDTTVVIDCHLHNNWRQLLLGGPGVDQQGRIQHIPGRLEQLTSGQRVIVKGADWQNLTFEQTIRQMLTQQCFESNGEVCPLPDDVQFYQMPVGKDELHSLFQSQPKEHAAENPIIINQGNITEWLSPIAITPEGYAIPNTCLLEQIRAGGVVTVTSPLTEALWFHLLGSLQTLRETTGLEPRLQVAHSRRQPKALGLAENDGRFLSNPHKKVTGHATFNTFTYQQHAQASHWINHQPQTPLVIQVNEQTGFSQLFDNIHITSEQKAHFGRRLSQLQEALIAGKPVVFRGLETNPGLQQLLEPLVVGQPLLVNGRLQAFPHAHVTMLWPGSAKTPSSVFTSLVAAGKPCPVINLWDINARRHEIPRNELPKRALNELYEAFKTVPEDLCNPLPEVTEGLLNNLILAARRAQKVDQSPQILPCHWRKAIDSVITHGTRQHRPVRDFMKVACWHLLPDKTPDAHRKPDQAASVDLDHLNGILNSVSQLDRTVVEHNFWALARAFDPAVFNGELQLSYGSPFPLWGNEDLLNRFCAMIVAHAAEEQRDAIAYQLKVDLAAAEPWQSLAIRPARQIKRLQDALASGWQLALSSGQTRADAIHGLASDCFHIARTANSEAERIERIEHRLSESLKWAGSADEPLSALARDLYHGEMNQKDRESRRLSRLHDRLGDSPVIFLQGETGTGKSYFSAKIARASGQASVISIGPSDSEQTLMKRWQWQQHADGDRSMAQQNRTLMEWAKTEPDKDSGYVGGNYITLVLDEANLAQAGLLASLNGLWEPEPCIYVNGHPVKVSEKHRVILTGNPDHYSGRQMDPALKEKLPGAYYPRLDRAFLRDRVVEPALVNQLQRHLSGQPINDIVKSATESVMTLWQYYPELLPDHEFTPRDLTDICSWVGWYLDRALPEGDNVTPQQINSLIQQSFRDVLGPEITETHQDAQLALEIWFVARYHPDNTLRDRVHNYTLPAIQQAFSTFSKEIRPEFDTSGSAVCELVQQLGQDLSRSQQAYHHNRKHGGRQATLIEGPAGRGKDATLNLVIESVRKQAKQQGESMPEVFLLNACDCSWDKVCEAIQKAKVDGGILVISEMNLIDSQHLEGELNDILAGDAHPGFHLFATINPPEYSGRKPLSPALKGRFRHLPIRQYNPTELQTIAEKVLPQTTEGKFAAEKLAQLHCRLRADLKRKNLPLQPTSLDLQNVAKAVTRGRDFSEDSLHQCLNQHYRLYLMAANLSLEELPGLSTLAMAEGALAPDLCHWLNETVPKIGRPWLIRLSHRNSTDEKNHEICINTQLSEEAAKTEIIRRVAQARWQASGLSLKPDKSDNMLTQSIYRRWQHCWFAREFHKTGVDANQVFHLWQAQEQMLKLSAYEPCLKEADRQIAAWNANAVQCWPAFWHRLKDTLDHINEALAVDADNKAGQYNPEVIEKETEALDRNTDEDHQEVQHHYDYIVFNTRNVPCHMYRYWAKDIHVTVEGDVKRIDLSDNRTLGVEILRPTLLKQNQPVTVAKGQTMGALDLKPGNSHHALPSMTPDDYIVALRLEPELPFALVRDKYTGLHTLSIPEAEAKQNIKVDYVVEPRKTEPRAKELTWFDTHCSEGMKAVLNEVFNNIGKQPAEIRFPLWKIKHSENTSQRIEAITDYCRQFSGQSKPEPGKNFFEFLVTQRQGSCRHRSSVFVAFCRYFGIPSRQIRSLLHSFVEYCPDGDQTWKSVDLGGSYLPFTVIAPDFQGNDSQPILEENVYNIEIRGLLKDLFKGADLAQQQALAKACGISLEELNKAVETDSALPEANISLFEAVQKLWQEKDLPGFSMGVSTLKASGTRALRHCEKRLIGVIYDHEGNACKPMSEAVRAILSNGHSDQAIEQLRLLHSKMIVQGGASPLDWLSSIVEIIENSDLANPSVIHFVHEALKSGWLEPLPTYKSPIMKADHHYKLLVRLAGVHKLRAEATHQLKKWYQTLLSREKNSQVWRVAYRDLQGRKSDAMFVTHCHDGVSSSLEKNMLNPSVQIDWVHEPEGVPNIERMLVHQPAFVKLNSGKAGYRPVITMGQPSWDSEVFNEKVEALLQRKIENSPELKALLEDIKQYKKRRFATTGSHEPILKCLELSWDDESFLGTLKNQCRQAIQQAFSHYLYEVTHLKGSRLTYCWADASIADSMNSDYYGAHDPSSPEELHAMICKIESSFCFQQPVKDARLLQQAHNASNALVLKSDELTTIAEEFLNSVNLNSLCESLDT